MNPHVTIKDIAKALGISTSTVSRALCDAWDVKRDTKEKVLAMAKQLNYRPNLNAKNLQNRRSGTIGIIIPEFVESFFPNVLMGIQEVLNENKYRMIITQSNENRKQELDNLRLLQEHMVDGIMMSITIEGGNEAAYNEVIAGGMPMVFFNRCPNNVNASKVLINDCHIAEKAVEHLINSGRRNIFHFKGPENLDVTHKRALGFYNALERFGINSEGRIIPAGIFIKDGELAMSKMLSTGKVIPDAIFCFNDPVAIGVIKTLKKNNFKIPEDIAIVGFSESPMATVIDPPLTSILQPMKEMGRQAAQLMINQLNSNRKLPPQTICLEAKLNIRESSSHKNGIQLMTE